MASIFQLLPLIIKQNFGKQELQRVPEPDVVTADNDNVLQYDRVMETKLAISYAIGIETIYRARREPFGGRALDLCCGPGHMSINMVKELKLDELIGVDLSAGMVETASKNAYEQGLNQASFVEGDATKLSSFEDHRFDLSTMMDAAHHMPSLELVTSVLEGMERVTKPDGLVFVMDLVRLRTEAITESYIEMLAHDYEERGLPSFKEDFRNSMYAAWTPDEIASAVPRQSKRSWYLIVPRGLPFAQFLIGCPELPAPQQAKRADLWASHEIPVSPSDLSDFRIARVTMANASTKAIA
ncbi:class I SAM-dependent methyltransferase [Roseiconus lacunae]|uniref:Class I SAM-dependent methyltransferase n=1 Tax=Roseiconus lacunae TaxID=2605694 RepID=A0ABT7PPA6_9BACT|nr:class I SAM-dependent methyltransferase [Roseiconus lacunae]MDM4018337.1 class I SAM-dependent methyltransferase [Roseiconus lacunae]